MSSTPDFTCVFCNEVFENKEILQVHFRKHGDPNFNSASKHKNRPQSEQTAGEKTDDGEVVGCDVCDETFPSISKAITHKHKVHPDHDSKYFCPWCGKLFTMKHLYNKHMQSNHKALIRNEDDNNYHCDSCDVDFYVPSAMVYHNRFFHRQDTELPAIGHSKKVKTIKQELIQIYYCPFCGEEYNNKVNLHKHMGDDHSDENQSPDEVLRCPLCEAVFYHLDAYELHLSFHSTEDLYENEMVLEVTDFSLESVPPIMEKVEEETKNMENDGIDNFLQVIMDESRESGNTDSNDRPKSKKHKKHKKSKKAAITFDEFLNMNKDVFGDGLDVQGIEEVPTQQVLKKFKGKHLKPVPASAIDKLKMRGITVKSNSGTTPILKTNKNFTVNVAKVLPNLTPIKPQEKPKTVASSNELLSKLLNQGNSQIKIVKRSPEENSTDKILKPANHEELTIQSIAQNNSTSQTADTEETNEKEHHEMDQDASDGDKEINNVKDNLETSAADNNVLETPEITEKNDSNTAEKMDDAGTECSDQGELVNESLEKTQNNTDMHVNDKDEDLGSKAEDNNMAEINTNSESTENQEDNSNKTHKSLNVLKHLSGIITIKPAQKVEDKCDTTETKRSDSEDDEDDLPLKSPKILNKNIQNLTIKKPNSPQIKPAATPNKRIDTLKNLNNQLTIKSLSTAASTSRQDEEREGNESDSEHDDISNKDSVNEADNITFKTPMSVKQTIVKKPIPMKAPVKEIVKEEDDAKKSFNMDILKRLTNVTAKPVAKVTNNIQVAKTPVQSVNSPRPFIQKSEMNKGIDKDIEIFNIDDSDSDQEAPHEEPVPKVVSNMAKTVENKAPVSADVLKNLSKNITIKPPSPSNKNITDVKKEINCERQHFDKNSQSPASSENKINIQKKELNVKLNQTLKKLGNNISIKSQHSSPDPHRYQMQHDDDDDMDNHFDSNDEESDPEPATKVKISEVQDDEDLPSDTDMEYNDNVVVQSPHESNSENEENYTNHSDDDENNEDIEKQIKPNTSSSDKVAPNACLDNFKRNNKHLTIKSLSEKQTDFPQVNSPNSKKEENTRIAKNISKDRAERQDENEVTTKKVNQSAASSSATQKVTNQVNTVKTVKTFQSETIIEEITTTVTKTIRTVNQSSKQVAQNANVNTHRPRFISPIQPGRPVQGMTVRNAVGTRIRNSTPVLRPTKPMIARPAGQLVPVRPQNLIARQGVFRPNTPGPSNIRKMIPQQSIQKPVIGKPLKISPLAMNQSMKRPSEETPGPFSCFKKPKESMIPSMDAFDDDSGDDSTVNYSSAASSRTDFSTTATKVVKGKAVVTATQARSEQHSEQHITKLNNMSGLKIVRSSSKQASQVETKSDNNVSSSKRTTLDAIERLQKQGLLIKKPRVEEAPEENEQYYSGSDGDFDENN